VQVVAQAERALAEAARVTEIAAAGKDPLAGPLRLGVIYTIGPWLLPALVPRVKALAPQMPLYIAEGYTENLLESASRPANSTCWCWPCRSRNPVWSPSRSMTRPSAPWCRRPSLGETQVLRPEQLLDEPLLMLGAGNCFRDQVLDLCTRASQGESPQVLEGSSLETIRHMVSSGVGVTVMPASSVDGIPADDPLLRVKRFVEPSPTRRVGLVWRSSFPAPQGHRRDAPGRARLPPAGNPPGEMSNSRRAIGAVKNTIRTCSTPEG
jgi:LysR family hydrogen peroxide-inducible transcriptional activator